MFLRLARRCVGSASVFAPQERGAVMGNDLSLFNMPHDDDVEQIVTGPSVSRIPRDVAIIALGEIPGVGHTTAVRLYDAKNFDSLFTANRDEVFWIASGAGVSSAHNIADAFIAHRDYALTHAFEEHRRFELNGVELLLDDDRRYPPQLRALDDHPRWLFVRGNAELLNSERLITVVGTREPSESGTRLAARVTQTLVKQGFAIVSGLAEGIDAVAHRETVDLRGQTIAVLGTGIFDEFPATTANLRGPIVQNGGAIITEFFTKERYSRQRFVQRNRIQAALSNVTIPVEARLASGTMHTIRFAKQYGRTVLGVKLAGTEDNELHTFLRENGSHIVEVPQNDDPFLEALRQNYNFVDFARDSALTRRKAQVDRAVRFARSVIKSETLSDFEIARMLERIKGDEE